MPVHTQLCTSAPCHGLLLSMLSCQKNDVATLVPPASTVLCGAIVASIFPVPGAEGASIVIAKKEPSLHAH